ncbi:MAG: hypothetical protein ISR84_02460 [Kiritimatiellales bacterium]|nr:hypothetical protein [Kiritimatiellales bacterium]
MTYTVVRDTDLVYAPDWSADGVTEAGSVVLDYDFETVTNTVMRACRSCNCRSSRTNQRKGGHSWSACLPPPFPAPGKDFFV